MYAIIVTGGKQFKVQQGDVIYVEKLNAQEGDVVNFEVLMTQSDDGQIQVGAPVLEGVTVEAKVLGNVKGQKIRIFMYKPKKNERKRQGHRQPYTNVEITRV